MRKRRLVWAGVATCLALALVLAQMVFLVIRDATKPPPVTRSDYEHVRVGMTREEVRDALRATQQPAEDAPDYLAALQGRVAAWVTGDATVEWLCDREEPTYWPNHRGVARMWFDEDGRVKYAEFYELPQKTPTLRDQVTARFPWLRW